MTSSRGWGSRGETGGRRGDCEGASDDDVVLGVGTNEHKRIRISHGGSGRRGGLG